MGKADRLQAVAYYWTGFVLKPSKPAEGTIESRLRGTHLGHAAAYRPDPQPDGGGDEGRARRRAAQAGGRCVMAHAKSDTPEARLKALMAALRAQGVTDPAVLSAIEKTPRATCSRRTCSRNGRGRTRPCRSPAARRSASRSSSA